MSAFRALDAARAAGIEVRLDGKDLVLSGASAPPADVIDMVRRHKHSVLGLLQQRYIAGAPVPVSAGAVAALDAGTGVTGTNIRASGDIITPAPAGTDTISSTSSNIISSADIAGFTSGNVITYTVSDTEGSADTGSSNIIRSGGISASSGIVGITLSTAGDTTRSTVNAEGSAARDTNGSAGDIAADSTTPRGTPADDWSAADWRGLYDEKAGIAEFDGGLPRPEAEKCGFDCCVAEWLYRHPVTSPLGPCPVCGDADRPNDDLLPVGVGGGEVWLHRGCSATWRTGRIVEAVVTLAAMGIKGPEGSST